MLGADDAVVLSVKAARLSDPLRDRTLPDQTDSSAKTILLVCTVLCAEHIRPTNAWRIIQAHATTSRSTFWMLFLPDFGNGLGMGCAAQFESIVRQ